MFEHLSEFDVIIVTGPHRSGTTIAAEMIANDTKKRCLREEAFDFYDVRRLAQLIENEHDVVVQCPALFDVMPKLSRERAAIVMMMRPLEQLRASRGRMYNPRGEQLKAKVQNERQLERLGEKAGDAAKIKYKRWDDWKKRGLIHHPVEISYMSLSSHPMWVPASDRRKLGKQWHNRRTEL